MSIHLTAYMYTYEYVLDELNLYACIGSSYAVGLSIFTVVSSYQIPVLLQRGRSVDSLESLLESGIRFFCYSIAVEVVTLMF